MAQTTLLDELARHGIFPLDSRYPVIVERNAMKATRLPAEKPIEHKVEVKRESAPDLAGLPSHGLSVGLDVLP